ncbi:rRNA maturation RNase YbeY [Bacillus amyloliquefaciens]|uniref:rRNA maturation RNase YbeY n=1 Tax=Bacillus amyloliquefaciens TaxID=1390 RepID=UPI00080C4123|nr:rRNA maturation RNase YbeY [Bacillus amyloliquefaciens]MEC5261049.1 rRNA maturation RNase YbeY [Bacillus amyloliquefaciens]OCB93773.1 Endoribonuclease YbeY [Bacillus amyloliquefaciens]QOQ53843.1 rRNA maturation RNase YbeY [Bacillus amyloliquefaciens]WJM59409.1 rRNA maturation RNase YbeY [Bacillus amyloliquefaciens]WJM60432.1 rRNA maturation RNase YbeY [Bacillus amyloliquefaciens]
MGLLIDIVDETNSVSADALQEVEKLLQFAAKKEGVQDQAEVSVTIVTNNEIREINRDYRGKDTPTDVISFALEEEGEDEVEIVGADMPPVLGDIIISADRTKEQAEEYGHSFMRELGFLAVHGFLHLLGYDHMTKEEEEEMFSKQKDLLDEYGLTRS